MKISGTQLDFTTNNQKFQTSMMGISNTGIGLRNTRRRLELLYGDKKHSLHIDDDNNAFHVHLILDLI